MRANDPASGDEFRWEFLTTANIERIEIVRGPQSGLWGSDAVAAVVNVISRSGSDTPQMDYYAEAGTNDTLNAGVSGGTGRENWSLGFGLEQLATDGTNISRVGNEKDGSDVLTASLRGRIQATDQLSFDFGLRRVDASSDIDAVDFFVTGLPVDGDLVNENEQTYVQAGVLLQTNIRHRLNARYLETENASLAGGLQNSSSESDRLTFSYQADISLRENLLSLALEHERTDFRQRGTIGFGDPNQDQDMSVTSIITDYQHHSGDNLTWLMSLRFDDNSDFDSIVSGRGSVTWQVTDRTRLSANIGRGQKSPTFIERFGFFPGQFVGNPNLLPEKSTAYEVGIEHRSSDNVVFGVTLFQQDLEDEINGFVFDPTTFLSTAENRSGASDREGVEISAQMMVMDNLEVSANYTYTDSSETNAGVRTRELRRPRHSGNVTLASQFLDERANVLLAADYGGTRNDIFFPPFPNPSQIVLLDNYWLVDITAGYQLSDRFHVFVRANNVLDQDYEQVYGFATPGRSIHFGLRGSLGQ